MKFFIAKILATNTDNQEKITLVTSCISIKYKKKSLLSSLKLTLIIILSSTILGHLKTCTVEENSRCLVPSGKYTLNDLIFIQEE